MRAEVVEADPAPIRSLDRDSPPQHVDRRRDAHVGDGVPDHRHGVGLTEGFVGDPRRQCLRRGQLPQARQQALFGTAVKQNPQSRFHEHQRPLHGSGTHRLPPRYVEGSGRPRVAPVGQRAAYAERLRRKADGGAQLHDRLVEVSGTRGGHHLAGGLVDSLAVRQAEQARIHPPQVAVRCRVAPVKGDAHDRAGGVPPDARQVQQRLVVRRQPAAVAAHHQARRPLQVFGAPVVAEAAPDAPYGVQGRAVQGLQRRERLHEAVVVWKHGGHLGLLEHGLGDPDGVGVAASPGQVTLVAVVPAQQRRAHARPRPRRVRDGGHSTAAG